MLLNSAYDIKKEYHHHKAHQSYHEPEVIALQVLVLYHWVVDSVVGADWLHCVSRLNQ